LFDSGLFGFGKTNEQRVYSLQEQQLFIAHQNFNDKRELRKEFAARF